MGKKGEQSLNGDPFEEELEEKASMQKTSCTDKFVMFLQSCWEGIKAWTWKTWLKIGIFLLFALGVVAFLVFAPWENWLYDFLNFIQRLGWWGPVLLAELYIACTLLFVPGSFLTIGAGFAFQSVWKGTVSVSIGSTIGACGAFLYGNTLLRKWVETKISNYPIFKAIDIAIAHRGWLVVLLLRLSPLVPFNLLNYALGLTRVGFWEYAIASWIGMLPATIVYVYIGTALSSLAQVFSGGGTKTVETQVLFWGGLVATIVALVLISVYAKKFISKAVQEAQQEVDLESEGVSHHDHDIIYSTDEDAPPSNFQ